MNRTTIASLLLRGEDSTDPNHPGLRLRRSGVVALRQENDVLAAQCFARSSEAFAKNTLQWAISMRLYGLVLVRLQREVEGTFALEKSDSVLDSLGCGVFDLLDVLD